MGKSVTIHGPADNAAGGGGPGPGAAPCGT